MPELCFPNLLPEFRFPSFASGSQKIGDFLGVALQVQQHEVLFALLKRTYLKDEFIKYNLSVLSVLAVVRESSVSNSIPP